MFYYKNINCLSH